ncbi:MAG: hypothetical protein LBU58_01135, partial [Clostridiales bacterium]|jgi:mannose-6-phosphate isomerase|nr:hypothetical protein [Clostridiales bacterium]
LIAEVQQNSNVTYRVYDYGRVGADGKPRPLHIDRAADVIDSGLRAANGAAAPACRGDGYTVATLTDWPYFTLRRLDIDGEARLDCPPDSFHALLAVDGAFTLTWEPAPAADTPETAAFAAAAAPPAALSVPKGCCVYIPAGLGPYLLTGRGQILLTSL